MKSIPQLLLASCLCFAANAGVAAASYTETSIPVSFVDISATGTGLTLSDDTVSSAVPLGFTFTFYGIPYTEAFISSNGFLTFLDLGDSGCCSGAPIPTASSPDGFIAGSWNDLYPPGGGQIFYETLGSPGSRVFVLMFKNIPNFSGSAPDYTFNIKLFEGSNRIEIHIVTAQNDGSNLTVGIENQDGTEGIETYHGSGSLFDLAYRYTSGEPGQPRISVQRPKRFSNTEVGRTSRAQRVRVRNVGKAPAVNLAVAVSGGEARDFRVSGPAAKALAPGASTRFSARFRPRDAGVRRARVTVRSNAPAVRVTLSGRGLLPAPHPPRVPLRE